MFNIIIIIIIIIIMASASDVGDLAEELTDALVTVGPRLGRVPSFATCCCACVPFFVPQQVPSSLSSRALNSRRLLRY